MSAGRSREAAAGQPDANANDARAPGSSARTDERRPPGVPLHLGPERVVVDPLPPVRQAGPPALVRLVAEDDDVVLPDVGALRRERRAQRHDVREVGRWTGVAQGVADGLLVRLGPGGRAAAKVAVPGVCGRRSQGQCALGSQGRMRRSGEEGDARMPMNGRSASSLPMPSAVRRCSSASACSSGVKCRWVPTARQAGQSSDQRSRKPCAFELTIQYSWRRGKARGKRAHRVSQEGA